MTEEREEHRGGIIFINNDIDCDELKALQAEEDERGVFEEKEAAYQAHAQAPLVRYGTNWILLTLMAIDCAKGENDQLKIPLHAGPAGGEVCGCRPPTGHQLRAGGPAEEGPPQGQVPHREATSIPDSLESVMKRDATARVSVARARYVHLLTPPINRSPGRPLD
ncbi:hypothetical protein J8273_1513 [Carpediemonas membranifera]|uniref:Uncharacterized protein n=1 Tax=Carpediemonas membranifera TaxID=201153 RepID=A0A8J6B083_9EUKA|nr:hypothetical protein J8273_1513 [Carpediemonas membranifera]|eukprot:KAG9396515.1 hypothetical protein J8273_1513 [Carpediemonas membranifera]